jgi:hypothetical protein
MKSASYATEVNITSLQQASTFQCNIQPGVDAGIYCSATAPAAQQAQVGHMQVFPLNRIHAEESMGFQELFQDMQSSLNGGGYSGLNEVVMGLDRDWFESAV